MPLLTKINTNVIADNAVTAAKTSGTAEQELTTSANIDLSGTTTGQKLQLGDAFTLTGDLTVNHDLVLGKVRDDGTGQSLTGDGKTLTGTGTLTMGGSLEGGEKDRDVTTAKISDGAVSLAKLADNAVTLAKMAGGTDGQILTYDASGDPVAVGPGTDGQVLTSTGAGSPPAFETLTAATLAPAFSAYVGNAQLIATSSTTKLQFDTELFDIGSVFDHSTNYRFTVPSGEGGKYLINIQVRGESTNVFDMVGIVRKNGSDISYGNFTHGNYDDYSWASIMVLNATDYLEVFIYHTQGGNQSLGVGVERSQFAGFKLLGL